jgi:hypothetical protein
MLVISEHVCCLGPFALWDGCPCNPPWPAVDIVLLFTWQVLCSARRRLMTRCMSSQAATRWWHPCAKAAMVSWTTSPTSSRMMAAA